MQTNAVQVLQCSGGSVRLGGGLPVQDMHGLHEPVGWYSKPHIIAVDYKFH